MTPEIYPRPPSKKPAIILSGVVDQEMYTRFRTQFDKASDQELVVIEAKNLGLIEAVL